jgi:hypothetical protein
LTYGATLTHHGIGVRQIPLLLTDKLTATFALRMRKDKYTKEFIAACVSELCL